MYLRCKIFVIFEPSIIVLSLPVKQFADLVPMLADAELDFWRLKVGVTQAHVDLICIGEIRYGILTHIILHLSRCILSVLSL